MCLITCSFGSFCGAQNFAARVISSAFRLPSRDQYTARTAFTTKEVEILRRER